MVLTPLQIKIAIGAGALVLGGVLSLLGNKRTEAASVNKPPAPPPAPVSPEPVAAQPDPVKMDMTEPPAPEKVSANGKDDAHQADELVVTGSKAPENTAEQKTD